MKKLNFTKMHGIGNDYIYVNCMKGIDFSPEKLAVLMSPRHFSVGSDGLVLICASNVADAKMRMFNADGSEGKMCGNAIRCIGKYLYDNGIVNKEQLAIETLSGIKYLTLEVTDGKVSRVSVDMGKAVFNPAEIPVKWNGEMINSAVTVLGQEYNITAVSVGNPHAVIFTDDISSLKLTEIGPHFENLEIFPERVNTEFVVVQDRQNLSMRVWERGSGETFACGTGASAVVAAAIANGYADYDTPVTVKLIGGELTIECSRNFQIKMKGTATKVYEGVYEYED